MKSADKPPEKTSLTSFICISNKEEQYKKNPGCNNLRKWNM